MYKKMKYLVYIILFLVVTFMTMAVFTQSKHTTVEKKADTVSQQETNSETGLGNGEETNSEEPIELNKNIYEEKNSINNTILIKNTPVEKHPAVIETKKQTVDIDQDDYYVIRSSKFQTINTQYDKEFGIMSKDVSGLDNTAVAQQLDKNSILFYIFDGNQKVVLKRLITNTANIAIKPISVTLNNKDITLKIQDDTKASNPNTQTIVFKEAEAPDSDWDIVIAASTETKPKLIYMNNSPAQRYQVIGSFPLKDKNFYIISYVNPKLYQNPGYINRSYYIYRSDNGKLVNIYHLFNRPNKASEDVDNVIEYTLRGSELWVGHKGSSNTIRKIPQSILFSQYLKVPSEQILFAPKATVEVSNIDINITSITPSMIKN